MASRMRWPSSTRPGASDARSGWKPGVKGARGRSPVGGKNGARRPAGGVENPRANHAEAGRRPRPRAEERLKGGIQEARFAGARPPVQVQEITDPRLDVGAR